MKKSLITMVVMAMVAMTMTTVFTACGSGDDENTEIPQNGSGSGEYYGHGIRRVEWEIEGGEGTYVYAVSPIWLSENDGWFDLRKYDIYETYTGTKLTAYPNLTMTKGAFELDMPAKFFFDVGFNMLPSNYRMPGVFTLTVKIFVNGELALHKRIRSVDGGITITLSDDHSFNSITIGTEI